MKKIKETLFGILSTRLGFVLTLVLCYWLKTMWAYHTDFSLGLENIYQVLLSIFNPIPLTLLLLGLSLYVKRTKVFYTLAWVIYTLLNVLLIANAIYYR